MTRFRPLAHRTSLTDHEIAVQDGSPSTRVNGLEVARIGDLLIPHIWVTPPFLHVVEPIVTGSAKTFADGIPVARATGVDTGVIPGDFCLFEAEIIEGSPNTFANE